MRLDGFSDGQHRLAGRLVTLQLMRQSVIRQ
jgi:hypothetical protein